MNDNSRRTKWNTLLRLAGLVAALGGMYISAQFSVRGFEFSVSGTAWVGWAIAIIIIVLESIWQKFGQNRTLFAIALGCYGYGIITNIVSIVQAKGGYSNVNWLDYLVAIFFGVLFEVFPEPVLAWAISGDVGSDPLGKFVDGLVEETHVPKQNNYNIQKKHIQMTPQMQNLPHQRPYKPAMPKQSSFPTPYKSAKPYPRESGYLKMLEGDEGN